MEPIWLSIGQAIAISGIKRTCMYHLINGGEVQSKKIGKRRFILRESILDLRPDMPSSLTVSTSISF